MKIITLILAIIMSIYFSDATVTEINSDTVVFLTPDGNEWEIENNGNYVVGQEVTIKFHTNYTDEIIEDDIILKVYGRR